MVVEGPELIRGLVLARDARPEDQPDDDQGRRARRFRSDRLSDAGVQDRRRFLVSYAAFKNHCSLFPASDGVREACGRELEPYLAGRGTIRFQVDAPSPHPSCGRSCRRGSQRSSAEARSRVTSTLRVVALVRPVVPSDVEAPRVRLVTKVSEGTKDGWHRAHSRSRRCSRT